MEGIYSTDSISKAVTDCAAQFWHSLFKQNFEYLEIAPKSYKHDLENPP